MKDVKGQITKEHVIAHLVESVKRLDSEILIIKGDLELACQAFEAIIKTNSELVTRVLRLEDRLIR